MSEPAYYFARYPGELRPEDRAGLEAASFKVYETEREARAASGRFSRRNPATSR